MSGLVILVFICFFLSGVTGLTYEILWSRMIVKIIGGAPFAVSIVLTVFMGGLGLGSYIAGRTIDRIKKPGNLVRLYGALELVIGLYGLALPFLIQVYGPVQAMLYNRFFDRFILYHLLTFAGCALLLFMPVVCMGATLPILCRFCVRNLSHLGTRAGRLYGINTLGAAAGSLLCGFWLIAALGVWGTLAFAVIVNAAIGLVCLAAGREPSESEGGVEPALQPPAESPIPTRVVIAALAVFGISGFCSMAYEVMWVKLLGLLVGPTTYSFTMILVTFITGLALGSMIFGRLADTVKDHMRLLLVTQALAAVMVLVISQVLGDSQLFFAKLIFVCRERFALLTLAKAGVLFAFMVLPTICLGATFPLVGKIYTRSVTRVGRSIGIAYSINTIGAVLGSFCAGFVIVPMMGKELGLSVVAGTQLAAALVIAAVLAAGNRERAGSRWGPVAGLAAAGLVLCFLMPRWNHLTLSLGKYHRLYKIETALRYYGWTDSLFRGSEILEKLDRNELMFYGEGIGGFTAVRRKPDSFGNYEYVMTNAGKSDASSKGDMDAQTMSGHFPMMFHENPGTVMVLGLASGVTAGEMLHYPLERLDVIDISTKVVEASDLFRPWNNNVLDDERTHVIIQDGRAHLQLTDRTYDVIMSEPSNPWMAGLATLFTKDFFELVRDRLNEGGVFSQWLHAYQMDWETFALVGRTFAEVFPDSVLLLTTLSGPGSDYVLIGFRDGKGLVRARAEKNLAYIKKSRNVRLTDEKSLYALVVAENLEELFGEGPVNTDSRPRLEFQAPRLVHKSQAAEIRKEIDAGRKYSDGTLAVFRELAADVDAQIDFAAYALSVHEAYRDMIALPEATPEQRARFFDLMASYCAENPIDYSVFKDEELKRRCRAVQIEALRKVAPSAPDRAASFFHLGSLFLDENNLPGALAAFAAALQADPGFAEAHNNIAIVMTQLGDFVRAESHFRKAVEIRPHFGAAYGGLGTALARQGKTKDAEKCTSLARRLRPDLFEKPGGAK